WRAGGRRSAPPWTTGSTSTATSSTRTARPVPVTPPSSSGWRRTKELPVRAGQVGVVGHVPGGRDLPGGRRPAEDGVVARGLLDQAEDVVGVGAVDLKRPALQALEVVPGQ